MSQQAQPKKISAEKKNAAAADPDRYELPPNLSEDDRALLHNVVTALQSTDLCASYRVDEDPSLRFFLVRGILHPDVFEVDSQDLYNLHGVSILRVERVSVARAACQNEIVVKVLNSRQRVMADDAAVFVPVKRRRLTLI